MSDAYAEFLNENLLRAYPFVEDGSRIDQTGVFEIPASALQDFRGFHRTRPDTAPQVLAIVGPDSSPPSNYPAQEGFYSVYFGMGRSPADSSQPLVLRCDIPAGNTGWPFIATAKVADETLGDGRDVRYASIEAAFSASIFQIGASNYYIFLGTALLEPCTVFNLYRGVLDPIRLIHEVGDDEYVGGDLEVIGGINCEVLQIDETLRIAAEVGGGEGRQRDGTIAPENSACFNKLFAINGASPDDRGNFTIKGGKGIRVVALPSAHKIQISPDLASLDKPVC